MGRRGWSSIGNEIKERDSLFASLAGGFESQLEGGFGDYVVDGHGYGSGS